jgi:cellulose synthase/poly-beta-1,6-N-acetylglucosamine synthase-like glycosyltransferase
MAPLRGSFSVPTLGMTSQNTESALSVIVPARNEEDVLGRCLESLVRQKDPPGHKMAEWGTPLEDSLPHPFSNEGKGWGTQGEILPQQRGPSTLVSASADASAQDDPPHKKFPDCEVIVVDDRSTDRTRKIAESFPVTVIEADPLPEGWSGKCNACWSGAQIAKGKWLLFTDADTVHEPNSIAQGLLEAEEAGAALLSYSPKQEVHGLAERALMPVVFAELAKTYRPKDVCDPNSPAAAANGQYLLVRRDAYDAVGGHSAVATTILEDVELARRVKQAGFRLQFRTSDVVRTRMYRSFGAMWEGWTKNLALLFPRPLWLAVKRVLEFVLIFLFLTGVLVAIADRDWIGLGINGVLLALLPSLFVRRIQRAHFDGLSNALAIFGLPLFSVLLANSYMAHRKGSVRWKGRVYGT